MPAGERQPERRQAGDAEGSRLGVWLSPLRPALSQRGRSSCPQFFPQDCLLSVLGSQGGNEVQWARPSGSLL